nr:hypothetical protein CFP56_41943 [Quercus suber]
MDETMKQFQEGLIELETEAEHLLLARHQLVENDRVRNGNREALTALRKRARTTKTSVASPFESIMRDIGGPESRPLVKEVCTTCGNHDSNERTWMMFPGTDLIGRIPFHAAHTILETDQAQLDFDAKRLQSYMKEKSFLISERGAIADRISPGVLKSIITLSDKPKMRRKCIPPAVYPVEENLPFMLPITIRCDSCSKYINQGTELFVHKEEVIDETDNKKILAVPAEVVSVLAVGLCRKLWLESFFNRDGH